MWLGLDSTTATAAAVADREAVGVVTLAKIRFSCCTSCWGTAEESIDDGGVASSAVTSGTTVEGIEDDGGGCWNPVAGNGAGRTPTSTMSSSSSSPFSAASPAVLLPVHFLLLLV